MARRGRNRGLNRIDAAYDMLTPMGFTRQEIRRHVDNLLKVYGKDGWTFIEEASYKLLIEVILEENEQPQPSLTLREDELVEAEPLPIAPPTTADAPPLEISTNDATIDAPPTLVLKPKLSSAEDVTSPCKIAMSKEVNRTNNILVDQEEIAAYSSIYTFPVPPGFEGIHRDTVPRCKRKPCLGWMGPKNDDDFVLLKPAPVFCQRTGERRAKRKNRWDVCPDDV